MCRQASRRLTARAVMMLLTWSLPIVAPTGMVSSWSGVLRSHQAGDPGAVGGQGLAGGAAGPERVRLDGVVRGGVERLGDAGGVRADREADEGVADVADLVLDGAVDGDERGAAGAGGEDGQPEPQGVGEGGVGDEEGGADAELGADDGAVEAEGEGQDVG